MPDRAPSAAAQLRKLFAQPGCVAAPGVADAFAARLVKLEGFEAVYMTGFGASLTRLGMPDVGLLTATEMIDNASRIVDASELPVIADADTGYGNPIYPNWVILAAIPAMQNILRELKKTGSIAHMRDQVATFKQFTEIAGLPEIQKLEEKYGLPEDQRAGL